MIHLHPNSLLARRHRRALESLSVYPEALSSWDLYIWTFRNPHVFGLDADTPLDTDAMLSVLHGVGITDLTAADLRIIYHK